jgi:hypothetical protein
MEFIRTGLVGMDGLVWVIDTLFLSFYFTFRRDTQAKSSTAKILLFSL